MKPPTTSHHPLPEKGLVRLFTSGEENERDVTSHGAQTLILNHLLQPQRTGATQGSPIRQPADTGLRYFSARSARPTALPSLAGGLQPAASATSSSIFPSMLALFPICVCFPPKAGETIPAQSDLLCQQCQNLSIFLCTCSWLVHSLCLGKCFSFNCYQGAACSFQVIQDWHCSLKERIGGGAERS